MFKTKEELILENHKGGDTSMGNVKKYNIGLTKGIDVAFKSFAERVEFYARYSNSIDGTSTMLKKDHPDIYKEWLVAKETYKNIWYMNWLFDYCFGDVIE